MKKFGFLLLGFGLLTYSFGAEAEFLYKTEAIRDRINIQVSYSKFAVHGKVDEGLEYLNKINPTYTLSFYDDSSDICPGWFKGVKNLNDSSFEFCWRPSKPLIEMKSKWAYGVGSNFILMPDKLSKINFGDADFYNQPEKTQACINADRKTANQYRNEVNFTNPEELLCAQQRTDNVSRDKALCQLPIEKKYNKYEYLHGGYVGTQIRIKVAHLARNDRYASSYGPKYEKYFSDYVSKYSLVDSDEIYVGNGSLSRTTIFGKDKSGRVSVVTDGFSKPINVLCVLNKYREVKVIETIDN